MEKLEQAIIGQLVAANYHYAAIFKKFNIDFCCKGNYTVEEACKLKNIDSQALVQALQNAQSVRTGGGADYDRWGLDVLASHIIQTHHAYVSEQSPVILAFLQKLCAVHGKAHPELLEVHEQFSAAVAELAMHMKKEEQVLFPYIRQMVQSKLDGSAFLPPAFGTVTNPVAMMMHEHTVEGDRFEKIRELTGNYTVPPDGCNTYRVTYGLLNEFADDLHLHIHLENNILFPKAVLLEESLQEDSSAAQYIHR